MFNITKGEWVNLLGDIGVFVDGDFVKLAETTPAATLCDDELIAEAGTVANECGLTPRQLLDQRNELIDALDKLANGMPGCGWDNGLVPRLQNARELLNNIKALKHE